MVMLLDANVEIGLQDVLISWYLGKEMRWTSVAPTVVPVNETLENCGKQALAENLRTRVDFHLVY